ncbi:MAG TPA: exodeoxyribonuclease III [Polyangiaceae bacterium]|nr:exodeoxyribonuclease III [Polyangiaceae bacterium]
MKRELKVATWNVNGLRAREAQFVDWVRRDAPDVVCLQEIKATPDQLAETLTLLPEYWNFWHGGPKGYSGVSLHVRRDAFARRPEFGHPDFDVECRVVQARLEPRLVVASVYVPNGGKDYAAKLRFLEAMRPYVDGVHASGGRLVLCGDLNVARTDLDVHPGERKPGAIGQREDERALFERVLAGDLVDVARALDPAGDRCFTWWPPWRGLRQKNQGWRIDYVLASAGRGVRPTGCRVLADVGTSDHAPVLAVLEVDDEG